MAGGGVFHIGKCGGEESKLRYRCNKARDATNLRHGGLRYIGRSVPSNDGKPVDYLRCNGFAPDVGPDISRSGPENGQTQKVVLRIVVCGLYMSLSIDVRVPLCGQVEPSYEPTVASPDTLPTVLYYCICIYIRSCVSHPPRWGRELILAENMVHLIRIWPHYSHLPRGWASEGPLCRGG